MWLVLLTVGLLTSSNLARAEDPELLDVDCSSVLSYAFIPVEDDCGKFVFCKPGKEVVYECHGEQIWSIEDGACVVGDKDTCKPWTPEYGCASSEGAEVIADPRDCRRYVSCGADNVEVKHCPPGEIFDEKRLKCIVGNSSNCKSLEDMCLEAEDGDIFRHPQRCDIGIVCNESNVTLIPCTDNEIFSEIFGICVPGNVSNCQPLPVEEMCTGRKNQILMHPDRCYSFVECDEDEQPKEVSCPRGHIFDPSSRTCVVGSVNSCAPLDHLCVNATVGHVLEYPDECDIYIECDDNETPRVLPCMINKIWSPRWLVCVPGDKKSCEPEPFETICRDQPYGWVFPHPESCTMTVQCTVNIANALPCPPNHIVEPRTLNCVPGMVETCETLGEICNNRTSQTISIPNDCENFIHCVEEEPELVPCPLGSIFDENVDSCIPGDRELCSPLECTKRFTKHPNFCHLYVGCMNGTVINHECPLNQIWHEPMRSCTPGSLIDCNYAPLQTMCKQTEDSIFPYPTDEKQCKRAVMCRNETASLQDCSPGMILRPEILDCFPGDDRSCKVLDVSCDIGEEWLKIHPSRCNIRLHCLYGTFNALPCDEGQIVDKDTLRCIPGVCDEPDPIDLICVGLENGEKIPDLDAENCENYFECEDEVAIRRSCSSGSIFYEPERICIPGTPSGCVDLRSHCLEKHDGFFVFPDRCDLYIECLKEQISVHSCPAGEIFLNEATGVCVPGLVDQCERLSLETMCEGRADEQIYPHPSNCTKYVTCRNESALEKSCSRGNIFSAINGKCFAGDSCQLFNGCIGESDGTILQHPSELGCDIYVNCFDGLGIAEECPPGYIMTSKTNLECVPGDVHTCEPHPTDEICKGQANGTLVPHPDSCFDYYSCENESAKPHRCADGNIFIASESICVPGFVEDIGSSACIDLRNTCEDDTDRNLEFPNRCDMFLVCSSGQTSLQSCPDGEIFPDENVGVCVPGSIVNCQRLPLETMCEGNVEGHVYPHPTNCSQYVTCRENKSAVTSCSRGNIYVAMQKQCLAGSSCQVFDGCRNEVDETVLPHPSELECDLFVECSSGFGVAKNCPPNHIITNITRNECVPGNITTCTLMPEDKCQGLPDGTLLHNPDSCVDYYKCQNNVALGHSCPDGYIFDQENYSACVPGVASECSDLRRSCIAQPDGALPFPTRCDLFLVCRKEQPMVYSCPPGEIFQQIEKTDSKCVLGDVKTCTPTETGGRSAGQTISARLLVLVLVLILTQ